MLTTKTLTLSFNHYFNMFNVLTIFNFNSALLMPQSRLSTVVEQNPKNRI